MGQTLSAVFGSRPSPTPAPDASESVPGPAVNASNTSVAIPAPTSVSVPGPAVETRNVQQVPRLPLPSYISSKMEDFVREMNRKNNCNGETFVDATYHEGERIQELITEHLPYVNITRVCVVKNSFLTGMYELKKAEYKSRYGSRTVKELTMFHATDANNVDSIIRDNLDWRRVYRNKYGIGVSFSDDPDYCNFHCTPKNGYHRVFIVASVLVCRQTYGDYGMVVPPESYDTAVGNNNLVYVKFNDNEFLPKYLAFYDSPSRSRSKYWINYHRRW